MFCYWHSNKDYVCKPEPYEGTSSGELTMKYKVNLKYYYAMVAIMLVGMIVSSAYAATATYTYDNLNRLTHVSYDNGNSIEYTYDAAGNITRVDKVGELATVDAPTVMTHAANNIASGTATLHGSVNANNAEAVVSFQYGTTTAYGSSIDAEPGVVDGSSDTSVSASLSDMAPSTTFHFRIVATNSEGTSYGEDRTFTTLPINNDVDMDQDDILDEWEVENYGNTSLDRDDYADMDTDGDGHSDLQEYLNGTDISIPDKFMDGSLCLMDNVSYTLGAGTYTQVSGTAGTNNIVLESGAKAQCLEFPGNNTITLASESGLFTVFRSGSTVVLHGADDTRVTLSATSTPQTIIFSDGAADLLVDGSDVVLGLQEVLPTPEQVQTSLHEVLSHNETFSDDLEHPDAYLVLTGSESYTLPSGSSTVIYGSSDSNKITVESGAAVKLLNFTGENFINIQVDYDQFEISRSGTVVHLQGLDGTEIYIPATTTGQGLCFEGSSYNVCASLVIDADEVLLDGYVVPMADDTDDPAEETVCDLGTVEIFDGNVDYGMDSGIEFAGSPTGTAAVFSRDNQSRIQYPYASDFPTEGTIEFWIKVENAYRYSNYALMDNQDCALIFTTDIQGGDVTWPGSAWLYVCKNGDISFHIAGEKYEPGWDAQYRLRATGTAFRFNEWHKLGVSYGSLGRYIMLNGTIVASDTTMTETLGAGGTHSAPVDHPTIGESVSGFWDENQWEGGFEGMLDRFRFSKTQKDWCLTLD